MKLPSCCSNPLALVDDRHKQMLDEDIPQVSTRLSRRDILGRWMARWGIHRMHYRVEPGLYRVGNPQTTSPVMVTANYKMTFDLLRSALDGIDAYILVLDTKGINVWCAAGKGTFGTDELIRRIDAVDLHRRVTHRRLILPQLSAPGIAAHEVKRRSGFRVIYGPVYARDIRHFMESHLKASPEMRRVQFKLTDRLALIPMEMVPSLKYVPLILVMTLLLQLANGEGWNLHFIRDALPYLIALLLGSAVFQILLPALPTRSFALKSALLGWAGALTFNVVFNTQGWNAAADIFIVPAIVTYLGMNFTGSTPFTSPSGVKRELSFALPAIILALLVGIAFKIIAVI
jgi:hypothetical protein